MCECAVRDALRYDKLEVGEKFCKRRRSVSSSEGCVGIDRRIVSSDVQDPVTSLLTSFQSVGRSDDASA